MNFGNILLILILVALNAFFVSFEFGIVASRRTRLDLIANSNSRADRLVRHWLENDAERDRLIAANQVGVTLLGLALGAAGENAFKAWLGPLFAALVLPGWLSFLRPVLPALPLIISLSVVTGFTVVFGEQVPKVATLRNPERVALAFAPVMKVFITAFHWVVVLLDWITHRVLGVFGIRANGSAHATVSSLEELRQIVASPEVEKIVDESEREMLSAVIDFGELVVRHVAVPRTEIVAVAADLPLEEAVKVLARHGLSKLPVYEDDLDHILGVLHIKDLLAFMDKGSLEGKVARDLLREALFVPASVPVNDLLVTFRKHRQHMAIVLDEFGGTAGLVTLEDLLEEIVGDVQDLFDAEPPDIELQQDGSALLDGKALIEAVNVEFGLSLNDPDYDTIAGYMLGRLGRIPQVGDHVDDAQAKVRLTVENMDKLRIARVRLEKLPEQLPAPRED